MLSKERHERLEQHLRPVAEEAHLRRRAGRGHTACFGRSHYAQETEGKARHAVHGRSGHRGKGRRVTSTESWAAQLACMTRKLHQLTYEVRRCLAAVESEEEIVLQVRIEFIAGIRLEGSACVEPAERVCGER
eukprot:6199157-Pleurochrysis_carterae.AAC.8